MSTHNYDEDKTQKWLRDESGKSFIAYLYERRNRELASLRQTEDLLHIGRQQGKVEILDWLIKLREES